MLKGILQCSVVVFSSFGALAGRDVKSFGLKSLSPSSCGFESRSGKKSFMWEKREVFQLTCGTSVVLPVFANIPIFICVESPSSSSSN